MALFRKKRAKSVEDPVIVEDGRNELNVNEAQPSPGFVDPIIAKDGLDRVDAGEVRPAEGFVDPIIAKDDFETPVFDEEEEAQP